MIIKTHDEIVLFISLAPLLLTLVIRRMSLNKNKQRSFLIQGLELVVTKSCLHWRVYMV